MNSVWTHHLQAFKSQVCPGFPLVVTVQTATSIKDAGQSRRTPIVTTAACRFLPFLDAAAGPARPSICRRRSVAPVHVRHLPCRLRRRELDASTLGRVTPAPGTRSFHHSKRPSSVNISDVVAVHSSTPISHVRKQNTCRYRLTHETEFCEAAYASYLSRAENILQRDYIQPG